MKGRSPTMRHVSRTHRVALDWLFDRINLDSKIQIKYTRHQKPTRRHLDKREISHAMSGIILLNLLNISHFSSTVCTAAMAKRVQQGFRRRMSHSQIATHDESYCKGAVERIILDFSKPGEEKLWKSKSLEYNY